MPAPAAVNISDLTYEPGDGWRWGPLGGPVGAAQLDAAALELEPGAEFGPYRFDVGRELWLLALAGTPTVCTPRARRRSHQAMSPVSPRGRPRA